MSATEEMESSESLNIKPLSTKQERRLVAYLDDRFLTLTRAYKKRTVTSESELNVRTLPDYLNATLPLLALILQIPPIDPSTSLRITFLLRFTGDTLSCIPGYPCTLNSLEPLHDWLDDLNCAWLAVLKAQIWDPEEKAGVDMIISADAAVTHPIHSSPMSQTERTRLKSLLLTGRASLEDWIQELDLDTPQGMQIRQAVQDLFRETLEELGEGMYARFEPPEVAIKCDDELEQ
jgi:hypothetical protein